MLSSPVSSDDASTAAAVSAAVGQAVAAADITMSPVLDMHVDDAKLDTGSGHHTAGAKSCS